MGLFHITTRLAWEQALVHGQYEPPSLGEEGFIHFSTDRQLMPTANRYYRGQVDLVVLGVKQDKLRCEIRYEESHGESFPHLYGPLHLDAVVEVVALRTNADGDFELPQEWQPWRHFFE